MNKTIFTILTLCILGTLAFISPPLKNTSKAVELANLDPWFQKFDQRMYSKTEYRVIMDTITDWSKKDPRTGKAPLRTREFRVDSTVTPYVGTYGLNWFSLYVNAYGYNTDIDGENIHMNVPFTHRTVDTGLFSGYTYWVGEVDLNGYPTAEGYTIDHTWYSYNNTAKVGTQNGYPEPTQNVNPIRSIPVHYWDIRNSTSPRKLMVKSSKFISKQQFTAQSGWSDEQLKWNTRITYKFKAEPKTTDDSKYILNMFADLEVNGDTYNGKVYFNGIEAKNINYRQLETSYGKLHPSYVMRWKLYNGDRYSKDGIYGATWVKEYKQGLGNTTAIHLQDNSINIERSNTFFWDASTNTLTVDTTATDCMLWFESEELPAQGKNMKTEVYYNLKTQQKSLRAY